MGNFIFGGDGVFSARGESGLGIGWGMQSAGPPPHPQALQDAEHLKLLAIFHYVLAGLAALFGSLPIFHVVIGAMMVSGKIPMGSSSGSSSGVMPSDIGWLFIVLGGGMVVISWVYAGLLFHAGRCLSARQKRTFCFVMGCISCIHVPLGTALGVFTILVLQRPSVQALFDRPLPGGYLNT